MSGALIGALIALRCWVAAGVLRSDLYLGAIYVRIMQQSTEDISAPWLLPEMVSRVADMLDYFLDHLAGLQPPSSPPPQ